MMTASSQITSGASSISQAAAFAALTGPQDCVSQFRKSFEERRNVVVEGIARTDDLTLEAPGGAFHTYIGCGELMGSTTPDGSIIENDEDFVQYLLAQGRVAAVPGSAYGLSPFFRFSTATSTANLVEAMKRLADCCSRLILQRE